MTEEMDEYVVRSIIDVAIFLEFSDERSIDPDISVEILEQLAGNLQQAAVETKQMLCSKFEMLANEYPKEMKRFVETLGESLGLIGD
ncbi:hypothetical protein ACQZ6C_00600 [Rhizobium rhizogenes]